eukprot:IDg532t1
MPPILSSTVLHPENCKELQRSPPLHSIVYSSMAT